MVEGGVHVDDDRDDASGIAWTLGFVAAGLGVLGGFLRFYRGSSFHWLDFGGDFSPHLPIVGAIVRGLVAPGLVAWAAYLGITGRGRVAGPLMLGGAVVWLAWMLQNWIDYASVPGGDKAGLGLFVMIAGAALAVAAGVLGTMRSMGDEQA
jgi:hypothetical protein